MASVLWFQAAENVAATRLEGNWTFRNELEHVLAPEERDGRWVIPKPQVFKPSSTEMVVSIQPDPAVLADLPEQNCGFLQKSGYDIFSAGILRWKA